VIFDIFNCGQNLSKFVTLKLFIIKTAFFNKSTPFDTDTSSLNLQKISGKLSRCKKMIDWDLFHLKRPLAPPSIH
jgi:hypothetical protein